MYLTPANLAVILLVGGFAGLTGGGPRHRGRGLPHPRAGPGPGRADALRRGDRHPLGHRHLQAVASTNVERGTANMRLGMTLEVATALGAIAGGLTAG